MGLMGYATEDPTIVVVRTNSLLKTMTHIYDYHHKGGRVVMKTISLQLPHLYLDQPR